MLNSKLLSILLINLALFAVNVVLFVDNSEEPEVKDAAEQIIQVNSEPIEKASVSKKPAQLTPVAPLPLVIEKKENAAEIAQRIREKQQNEHRLALLEAQLALLDEQNTNLKTKINSFSQELIAKDSHISALQKTNEELQLAQSSSLASDVELLKTTIESQPDLLETKSPESPVDKPADEMDEQQVVVGAQDGQSGIFSGSIEFGFSYEQDSSRTNSANGRLILNYEQPDLYKLMSNFKFELEEEDSEMSTEKYRWQLQGDKFLDPRNFVFARSDMERTQFSSYERKDIYTLGYGRIVFAEKKHEFNVEVGPGYRIAIPNVDEDAVSVNEFILRNRLYYKRVISEPLQVSLDSVWEVGKENSIYSGTFKVQSRIYRQLYLILESEYEYTQNVPEDTPHEELSTELKFLYAF